MPHKVFEEAEFLKSQFHVGAVARYASLGWVKFDAVDFEYFRQDFVRSAQKRSDARCQFSEREWLDEIIVGPAQEQVDFRFSFGTCGKDEYGNCYVPFSHLSADLMAIHGGQHEVQNDQVVIVAMQRNAR